MLKPGAGPFPVLFAATVVVWLASELRQGLQRRPEAVRADRGSLMVVRVAYVAGVLVAIVVERALSWAEIQPEVAALAGLIVLWCGVGLRLWSFWTLGRYFTFTVQTSRDQPVITQGPYRLVRHPGYLGLLLAIVGIGLTSDNWAAVVGLSVVAMAGLVYRITVEERAMLGAMGDRYREYAAMRKRLIPLVW